MDLDQWAHYAIEKGAKCFSCEHPSRWEDIRNHDNPTNHAWVVEGCEKRQWLYFECSKPACRYQTSFAKLKIPFTEDEISQQELAGTGLKMVRIVSARMYSAGFAYMFFGDRCVFTSVDSGLGSSVNKAEYIAMKIAEVEDRDVSQLRFFDLKTRYAYGPCVGDFEFKEVILIPDTRVHRPWFAARWLPVKCPSEVLEAFKRFLTEDPKQQTFHEFDTEF